MNWFALIIIAIGGVFLTIGDLFMKKWVVSNSWVIYAFGMVLWFVGLNFLAFSFKFKNIAVASVMFMLFNVLSLLLFSYFYFKEGLSFYEITGLVFGIIAIVLLEFGE